MIGLVVTGSAEVASTSYENLGKLFTEFSAGVKDIEWDHFMDDVRSFGQTLMDKIQPSNGNKIYIYLNYMMLYQKLGFS